MSAFNQLYNYKANWNNSYSTTKEISSYWNAGGAGPTTVYDYLSTNNVVIQSSTILNYLSVVGNATVLGNLTAYGDTTFVNTLVTVTTAASGEFNNLLVGSLTAIEFFNPKFDSVYNTVYALSNFWDEENALVAPLQSASANWNSTYTSVSINSSGWESTETNVRTGSANWNSVYNTVYALSNFWDEENALVAPLQSASANWNAAYTNLIYNSANYLTGTAVNLGDIPVLSANWNNTYTAVSQNSADWNNTYTQFSTNSATYATIGFADGKFLPVSGGNITGDLTVNGNLTALGTFTFLDTLVTVTSALSVYNAGTGPALVVQQTGSEPVARFFDSESGDALYIANNGRVGIGTANPDTQLYVVGTTYVEEIKEKVTLSASNFNSTINFDILNQSILFATLSSSSNWIINFRGDDSSTLNSIMSAGQSFTCVAIVSTGTTTYYNSAVQIDGSTYVPYYLNGLAPQAVISSHNSIQNYAYTIIKRGNAVFNVLASVNEYY